jgi:nicotinamidase-related amidase
MPAQPSIDPARTALLSMDFQTAVVSIYGKYQPGLIPRAQAVLRRSRILGMAIIHVQVAFRPNFPEISPRNALFSALKTYWMEKHTFEGTTGAIHPELSPEGDDIVVTKRRVSAFAGTDLEVILRAKNIDTLVLMGIATSGVVLSTLLHASDQDYRLLVLVDCCADQDPEVHACLIDKVFPRRATVLSADQFLDAFQPIEPSSPL